MYFFIFRLQEAEASHQEIQQEKFQLESNLKVEIETAKVHNKVMIWMIEIQNLIEQDLSSYTLYIKLFSVYFAFLNICHFSAKHSVFVKQGKISPKKFTLDWN